MASAIPERHRVQLHVGLFDVAHEALLVLKHRLEGIDVGEAVREVEAPQTHVAAHVNRAAELAAVAHGGFLLLALVGGTPVQDHAHPRVCHPLRQMGFTVGEVPAVDFLHAISCGVSAFVCDSDRFHAAGTQPVLT